MRYYIGLVLDRVHIAFFTIKKLVDIAVFYIKATLYFFFNNKQFDSTSGAKPFSEYKADTGRLCDNNSFKNKTPALDLSIIIPAYNCDKYIINCLQSILCQKSHYSYEIIVVDDGSVDNTYEVVKQLALKEDRIVLLRQNNSGQSVARNKAVYISNGRYLMFVDADDLLTDNSINKLMDIAVSTNSDIAEGDVMRFNSKKKLKELLNRKKDKEYITVKSSKASPAFVLTCYGYSVAKVFRRELWNDVRFPEGYIFEDIISKFILRRKANQVAFTNSIVYAYRWNPNSSSHGKDLLKALDSFLVFPKVLQLCQQTHTPMDNVFYFLSINHIGLLNRVTSNKLAPEVQLSCFEEMRKQLLSISSYRPKKIPLPFAVIEKSIILGDIENWKYFADTINNYKLLKKYREIN